MRVGITVAGAPHDLLSLMRDNRSAFHLLEVFKGMKFVDQVYLVGHFHESGSDTAPAIAGIACVHFDQAVGLCNMVVQSGATPDGAWIQRFRESGGRMVLHLVDDPYERLAEGTIFKRNLPIEPIACYDAVWLRDGLQKVAAMLHTLHRCPVEVVPALWSPAYVDMFNTVHQDTGMQFGFGGLANGATAWRCVINARNSSVSQMGVVPAIIVDQFLQRHRDKIARVEYLNGSQFAEQYTFNFIVRSFAAHRAGIFMVWDNSDFTAMMARHGDLLISHKRDAVFGSDQLDALYAGYPLVHNQDEIADIGYYYPHMDVDAGVVAMQRATADQGVVHQQGVDETRKALLRYSPNDRGNISRLSRLVFGLFS